MNPILNAWNAAEQEAAVTALLSCCASQRWAGGVAAQRPFGNVEDLFAASDKVWATMQEPDWMEAFRAHPRIGERKVEHATSQSKLAAGNERYEQLFGITYIVCATGKSADEMLAILQRRLMSDRQTELREAAEQQRQITQIRLRKWLQP